MINLLLGLFKNRLANRVVYYYKKMKQYEALFRDAKSELIKREFQDGKSIVTRLGSIKFQKSDKPVVDMDKVKEYVTIDQLIKLGTINTNALMKMIGANNFKSVISGYKTTYQIIIK